MQKHLKIIADVIVFIGIGFVWGCGGESGEGAITIGGGTYSGQLVNGVANGFGTWENPGGDRYEGAFKDGLFHGQGIELGIQVLISGRHTGIAKLHQRLPLSVVCRVS